MQEQRITGRDLRRALKGRTSYVCVIGTETWLRVSHREVMYLCERNDGLLYVSVEGDNVYIEGNTDEQHGPSRVEYNGNASGG